MLGEEILFEIESTLDSLITNAEAIKDANLSKEEIDAFQKTQESLLAHLMHMDDKLKEKKQSLKNLTKKPVNKEIKEKISKFEKLNKNFIKTASEKINLVRIKKI